MFKWHRLNSTFKICSASNGDGPHFAIVAYNNDMSRKDLTWRCLLPINTIRPQIHRNIKIRFDQKKYSWHFISSQFRFHEMFTRGQRNVGEHEINHLFGRSWLQFIVFLITFYFLSAHKKGKRERNRLNRSWRVEDKNANQQTERNQAWNGEMVLCETFVKSFKWLWSFLKVKFKSKTKAIKIKKSFSPNLRTNPQFKQTKLLKKEKDNES